MNELIDKGFKNSEIWYYDSDDVFLKVNNIQIDQYESITLEN
ncbi:MAG: hypothetical protein ABF991_00590 [Liquorilactobacillus hordei]